MAPPSKRTSSPGKSSPSAKRTSTSDRDGLPSIENICDILPNCSPSPHPIPKDLVYTDQVETFLDTYLNYVAVKTSIEKCSLPYVRLTEEQEAEMTHPFMVQPEYLNTALSKEKNAELKGLLRWALRVKQLQATQSTQGCLTILATRLAHYFGANISEIKLNSLENLEVNLEQVVFAPRQGIIRMFANQTDHENNSNYVNLETPDVEQFMHHMQFICALAANPDVQIFCKDRLDGLVVDYRKYVEQNGEAEELELSSRKATGKCMEAAKKVDTHCHAGACMPGPKLLSFVKAKLSSSGSHQVMEDGKSFHDLLATAVGLEKVTPDDLTLANLKVYVNLTVYRHFDAFNRKLLPFGCKELKKVLLQVDNLLLGQWFAELLKEVIADMKKDPTLRMELRISVNGKSSHELEAVANWWNNNQLHDDTVKWIIQIPRKYSALKNEGHVESFQEMMSNVFLEMFKATINPEKHKALDKFLSQVVGFDLVDNEDVSELPLFDMTTPKPDNWTGNEEPNYTYYMFYVYANMSGLNKLRKFRKLNTFTLRPHCGEGGALQHLAAGFLMADSICHGLNLIKVPVIHYLFFLTQLGVALSPTSNHRLFKKFKNQPLRNYIETGLRCTISTDDPLVLSESPHPLLEEYVLNRNFFEMSDTEIMEFFQNGALMSGFSYDEKVEWTGPMHNYQTKTIEENYLVPVIRLNFRQSQLEKELDEIFSSE